MTEPITCLRSNTAQSLRVGGLACCTSADAVKPPVLVLATSAGARNVRAALADRFAVTIVEDVAQARALLATGAYLAVVADGPPAKSLPDVVEVDATSEGPVIVKAVAAAIDRLCVARRAAARDDEVGAVPYERFIELARYASIRRYLMSLLSRHRGSVTDAARAANMKRESLHRLLRRHHLLAEDFRDR